MDDLDRAQEESNNQLSNTLSRLEHRRKLERAIPSAENCMECGNEIPKARQEAMLGCQLCIYCAEKFEIINRKK